MMLDGRWRSIPQRSCTREVMFPSEGRKRYFSNNFFLHGRAPRDAAARVLRIAEEFSHYFNMLNELEEQRAELDKVQKESTVFKHIFDSSPNPMGTVVGTHACTGAHTQTTSASTYPRTACRDACPLITLVSRIFCRFFHLHPSFDEPRCADTGHCFEYDTRTLVLASRLVQACAFAIFCSLCVVFIFGILS